MQKHRSVNVLLIGRTNSTVDGIKDLLAQQFLKVVQINGSADDLKSVSNDSFNLIAITGHMDHKPDNDLINHLKMQFPEAKILGLFNRLNQESEIRIRSAGLIFLGSYEHFGKNVQHILGAAFRGKYYKPLKRKELAR